MDDADRAEVQRLLAGAELWAATRTQDAPRTADASAGVVAAAAPGAGAPVLIAGWEDGHLFCQAVCTTDVGLTFCRRCPTRVAHRALRSGHAGSGRCPAGVRLLAFPVPAGTAGHVAVLRVAPPAPREAADVAERVRVAPAALRRAARDAEPSAARDVLRAARRLRDPAGLLDWQVLQRDRGADRRRTAAAALAQMIATSEEFHDLYRAAERQRRELDRNHRRLERLAREALRATDSERARIAHQIHDTAAQSMVSAYRFLDAARARSAGLPEPADALLREASDRVRTAIQEVRAVLDDLLPPGLEELGLAEALRIRLRDLTAGSGATGVATGDLPRLEGWVEQALYGMAGEAISNAIRHGAAKHISISLREWRGRAIIVIVDDGRGFEPATVARRRGDEGLGLLGMTRQARWLGGRMDLTSRPGSGTRVSISIPLERHRLGATKPVGGLTASAPSDARTTIDGPSAAPPPNRTKRDRRGRSDAVTAGPTGGTG
jgi:signal transduction histidine kinase